MGTIEPREVRQKDGRTARIRTAKESDAEDLIRLTRSVIAEPGFMVTTADEFQVTPRQEREWIRHHAKRRRHLAIVAETEAGAVGLLNFQNGPRRRLAHRGRFGMSVHRDWRGLGLGGELLRALLDWAEAEPGIEKVCLSVLAGNAPAIALYRKFGFREEGRRVREVKYADGTWSDDVLMYRFVGTNPAPGVD